MSHPKIDHTNTRCCICGSRETYIMPNGDPSWRRHKENGIWDGKSYKCESCRHKSNTKYRNNKIDKNSTFGMTIISQAVVKKVTGSIDCTRKMNNCNYSIDLLDHKKNEKIDVKYSVIREDKEWYFRTKGKLDTDIYFCMGLSKDSKNIAKVWIIPNEDWVVDLKGISIHKESCYRYSQYEIDSKLYNNAYQSLMLHLKSIEFFGIDDIRKWLKE